MIAASNIGKRVFSANRIQPLSRLGKILLTGKDSQEIIEAIRTIGKTGEASRTIRLKEPIAIKNKKQFRKLFGTTHE